MSNMERRIIPHKTLMESKHKSESEKFFELTEREIGKTINSLIEQRRTDEILYATDRFTKAFVEKLKKENSGKINAEQAKIISEKLLQMSRNCTKSASRESLDAEHRNELVFKSAFLSKVEKNFREAIEIATK